ncbi:MAG: hydroxymethylbilane synthase [Prolixibacteraceae bacterium]|nr:hydroxymethylbilane synthase [Prolixibacteraceae bacterium]
MKDKIIIGTRGSKLALYQAEKTKEALLVAHPALQVEIKIIQTKGDKILDVALSKIGDKGLFTKEIEVALLNNEADIAVHSLKDLPTSLPEGLELGAVLERGEFRDALVNLNGKKFNELSPSDIVATSSLRRQAALLNQHPDITIKDIRGNVQTRLKRMEEGYCDAMIMAAAGLQRLGLEKYISEIIDPTVIMPAVAQGTIAIEIRENDNEVKKIIEAINHQATETAILAERTFLRTLEGGCQVPLGCYSQINGENIVLHGFVASTNGKEYIKETENGSTSIPEECGVKLAQKLINKGAKTILEQIRKNTQH